MRFVLPLVALCAFSSAPLRADMFDITFSGTFSRSGTFTTDGICSFCTPGFGLLDVTINIGPDSGPAAFDISDDSLPTPAVYLRERRIFVYDGINSETGDRFTMNGHEWNLISAGSVIGAGVYSFTGVPEPSYLFLLMPSRVIVGLRWRHQRHRV